MRPRILSDQRVKQRDALRQQRDYPAIITFTTDNVVQKPVKSSTELAYSKMLDEWDDFAKVYDGPISVHNIKTLKDFLVHFAMGRKGRIDQKTGMMTQKSLYTSWKCFMTAWRRKTNDVLPLSTQTTIKHFIRGGDGSSEGASFQLPKEERPVRNFTPTDFRACIGQLWQNDWYDFRSEIYRVGLHLMLLLHVSTAARSAEYVANLNYGDTEIWVTWLDDHDQPIIVVNLCRRHLKGHKDLPRQQPKHLLYELIDQPYYYNTVAFFLSKVLALDGLRDFHSWEAICAIEKRDDREALPLHYQDHILEKPVFPRAHTNNDSNALDTSPASTSLIAALANLGDRTGFQHRVTPHAIRREHLLQVDAHGYSINERMRHAGHLDAKTYGAYYQCSTSIVDGQATYLGLTKQGPELHELFRGFSIHRDHNYNPRLRAKHQLDLNETFSSIWTADDDITASDQQKRYDAKRLKKQKLLRQERLKFEDNWANTELTMPYESDFCQTRKLMPERDRLADSLFESGSLRSENGRRLMSDLVSLCSRENSDTFCQTLNSKKDECDTCGKKRLTTNASWWYHVYRCRRKHALQEGRSEQFCFLCFQWVDGEADWTIHAEHHLSNPPLKCKLKTFRGNVIRPGLCLECLGNTDLSASQRLCQYLDASLWRTHIKQHFPLGINKPLECRHPCCQALPRFGDEETFAEHRFRFHDLPLFEGQMRKRYYRSKVAGDQVKGSNNQVTDADLGRNLRFVDCNVQFTKTQNSTITGIDRPTNPGSVTDNVISLSILSPTPSLGSETSDFAAELDFMTNADKHDYTAHSPLTQSECSSWSHDRYDEISRSNRSATDNDDDSEISSASTSLQQAKPQLMVLVPPRPSDWELFTRIDGPGNDSSRGEGSDNITGRWTVKKRGQPSTVDGSQPRKKPGNLWKAYRDQQSCSHSVMLTSSAQAFELTAKRGRGRPKGSKNKLKSCQREI